MREYEITSSLGVHVVPALYVVEAIAILSAVIIFLSIPIFKAEKAAIYLLLARI